jgi:hypothetical protein
MKADIPNQLETAEERATRMWRNNVITKSIQQPEAKVQQPSTTIQHDPSLARIKRIFHKEIMSVFETNRRNVIMQYQASIAHQKRILMLEKLRRLENDNNR